MINRKNIFIISFLISILLTGLISIYLYSSVLPLNLKLANERELSPSENKFVVHDYDKDGRSEWFEFGNKDFSNRSIVLFYIDENLFVEEFSAKGKGDIRWNHFTDINDDGKDDIILFTVDKDSLLLTIIDLHSLSYIEKERFILTREKDNNLMWDLACYYIGKIKNELYFFIGAGYSHHPRVFISYDLTNGTISNSFKVSSIFTYNEIISTEKDADQVIVSVSSATGNIPEGKFNDMTNWILMFDPELNLISKPKNFGEYPKSGLYSVYLHNNKNSILVMETFSSTLRRKIKVHSLNDSLIIKNTLEIIGTSADIKSIKISGKDYAIIAANSGKLILVDENLEVKQQVSIGAGKDYKIYISDHNYDGEPELYLFSEYEVFMYSDKFDLLLEKKFSRHIINEKNFISIDKNNKTSESGILINTSEGMSYYNIIENKNYNTLPIYSILLLILNFLLMFILLTLYNVYQLFVKRKHAILRNHSFAIFDSYGWLIQKSPRFNYAININSLDELLEELEINTNREDFLTEIRDNKKTIKLNDHIIEFILIEDNKYLHEPIIYAQVEFNQLKDVFEKDVWSKSIQKIAHDIKTPLSSILLNLKAIGLRLEKVNFIGKDEVVSDIDAMKAELDRINNLTRGFLRFTNIDKPKFKITNLAELIEDVRKSFSFFTNNGIQIEVQIDRSIYIYADDHQIKEVFQVIIENGIEAMNHSGIISISAEIIDENPDTRCKEVMITISDHGEGMSESALKKVFNTTFTSKPTGNGLGLRIAKKIIDLHKGKIEVYSKLGIGSTFKIFLPLEKIINNEQKNSGN
ncbi:MAG: HAMP domain-containing sensor histidine kinase [Melioribacteraceae bacterium]|nr:MAG: HAMP domain-containing sensor histidine kinase [Melioribacteraceae bacterium]